MITSLAQSVALVAHGNAFLAGSGAPPRLEENSAFEAVATLRFVFSPQTASGRGLLEGLFRAQPQQSYGRELATTTAEWLEYLRRSGITRLSLLSLEQASTSIPLYVATAFAGFTHWVILAESDSGNSWWSGTEQRIVPTVTPESQTGRPALQGAVQSRVWQVMYTGTAAQPGRPMLPDMSSARERLRTMLDAAIQFADTARADYWRDYLMWALEQLGSSTPQARHYWDMLPEAGYPMEAHQLLATASSAWVFGGAGYWNDLQVHPSLREQYELITPALYEAVMNGIIAATNAFDPALD